MTTNAVKVKAEVNNLVVLTDHELIMAFYQKNAGKPYRAIFTDKAAMALNASNLIEARQIAREYGARILGRKLVHVYYEGGNR